MRIKPALIVSKYVTKGALQIMDNNLIEMTSLADALENFIQETIPESATVQKYGGTLYTLRPEEKEDQFCGVFMHKKHVQISFSKGGDLKDPKKLLSGTGKLRRHVNFRSAAEVDFKDLEKLLKQAAKL